MVAVEQIRERLKTVYDPELGVNIVDLGLVYDIETQANGDVHVVMTLTTPGCPLHDTIAGGARNALESIPGVGDVAIELVWEPAWTPEMMSEAAREQLG